MARLTVAHLCGCCRPASGHTVRGVSMSERGPANPELGEYKESVGSCPQVLHVSFSCFSGFSLALDRGGRLGGKVGSVCKKFKTMQQQFWTKKFFLLCP